MLITRLAQHIWNKVYFNVDLPKNRNYECNLTIGTALFDFFVPTTKRKNSVGQWLGSTDKTIEQFSALEKAKAIFLFLVDFIFFIPRLVLNIIKLVTEVLPLTLRELAYAAFESMLEGAKEASGISRGLYKLAAGFFWFLMSLCNVAYFVGCLISSPGYTILAIKDTFKELGYPRIGNLVAGLTFAALFMVYLIVVPFAITTTLPAVGVFLAAEPLLAKLVASAIYWNIPIAQLIFNTEPDKNDLTAFLADHGGQFEWFSYPETTLSIRPSQFMKLFADDKDDSVELKDLTKNDNTHKLI